jgi:hypothetical protein
VLGVIRTRDANPDISPDSIYPALSSLAKKLPALRSFADDRTPYSWLKVIAAMF